MKFAGASLEVGANGLVLAAIIAAGISASASTGGMGAFLANFLVGAGFTALRNVIDGIQGMIDSTAAHNPLVDVIIDAGKAFLDLATIVSNVLSMGGVISASGMKAVGGTTVVLLRILGAAGQIIQGQPVQYKNALAAGMSTVSGAIGAISGATLFLDDMTQLHDNWQTYQDYSATHE